MPPTHSHLTRSHIYTVFLYLLIPDPTLNRRNQRTAIQVLRNTPQLFETIIIPVSPPPTFAEHLATPPVNISSTGTVSFLTTRPIAAQPYDRQRRPALLGRDTSADVAAAAGTSIWGGGMDPNMPATFIPNPPTPPQQSNDMMAAMREMMESMEGRMEARIQQALNQRSGPPSAGSQRPLPRIPREAPPPPPGPPTPPPPLMPFVNFPDVPQARNGPKMARPEVFDGERAKCRTFIRNIEVYVFVNGYQFPNKATKVLFLLSYVQGKKVDNWKNTMTGRVLEWARTQVPDEQVSSLRRICRSLQEAFGDPNPRDTAITALAHLHQGSDMAEDYVMKFNAYKDDTGYNDVALVELFKRGLNTGLLTRIYGRRPLPGRCEEWQEEAIALDRQWREAQAYTKAAPAKPAAKTTTTPQSQWHPYYQKQTPPQNQQQQQPQPAKPTPPAPQITARDPNAMDVDRSQRGPICCYKCGGLGTWPEIAREGWT
ncbi:hypothetical protein CCMSSC00406_0001312 [Pleurotus cornucopiae]|uniref:Uncharacterized protein n=1 Tax=Pleurotus cornucopiae TaxID=5321 RepID=A0ACB7ILJ9_PLECO|nr:hypothetical protein CCMSSC00406_0001312 [Pleurotus cornucopiae]